MSSGSRVWLTFTVVAYGTLHHVGSGLSWLGSAGKTQWADWADLITPYAFLLGAAAALHAGQAGRRAWAIYLVGAVTYAEGHGIHLAANSIGNVSPGEPAHLWDEVVGHYVWYGGVVLVFAALILAFGRDERADSPVAIGLTLLAGVTFATNCLEGGTAAAGIAVATGFAVWGWAERASFGRLWLIAGLPAMGMLAGYGIWHKGFPQPSELGWI